MNHLRRIAVIAVAAASIGATAGCGGSDKPGYCDDRDNLEQSVNGLKDINLSEDGVKSVQTQVQKIETDARAFTQSAKSEFQPQSTALKSSLSALGTAVGEAVSSPSAQSLATVADDISKVGTAFNDLADATSQKC
ncbi:MAG TPA: hypothetical protein VGJ70_03130 [Solirubrobacteraceae bacterium]